MKREILFRGKKVDNGEWVHGKGLQQCKDELGNEIVAIFTDIVKSEKYIKKEGRYTLYYMPVKAETLGQYTGLKDKNGKKIFEGDIVHLKGDGFGGSEVGVDYHKIVSFNNGSFCLSAGEGVHFPIDNYFHGLDDWDVIGNVHDNLELIK
nr:MAG TPA: YopX protein [Caudoviricetes sp.]